MAVYYKIAQRTPEWFLMKLGKPGSSEFKRIVTPGGKLSSQAADYMHVLLAELMLGHPIGDDIETQWMVRGTELEDEAIKAYEFSTGIETEPGGYVANDAETYGCSPDRLVGDDGVLEIKCPAPNTHVGYLLSRSEEKEKKPQVQGQMLVTGRKFVDLVSYHPKLPVLITRVERDEPYIALLRDSLDAFCETMAAARKLLEDRYGPFPDPTGAAASEPEFDHLGVSDADIDEMIRHGLTVPAGQEI